jgi:glycosyltransferase involved in cell wall biosynthesis
MAPVPIAFCLSRFDPGGTERQMIELLRRLDRRRWTVHLACFEKTGAWFERAAEAAASVAVFPVTSFRNASIAGHLVRFSRWCREQGIAVVHTTEMPSNIFGLTGAALARVPVRIGSRREINRGRSRLDIATQRAAYCFAHTIVANSRAAANRLLFERVPSRKVTIIPNGLDLDLDVYGFNRGGAAPRSTLRNIVVVANLRAEKGHDVLIDAAADVLRRFPDTRFEVVGTGPERERLVARSEARRVAHAFLFLGHREDVTARLMAADIFVLPSRSEAFPNAVLEAMATGLPIVASGVGGIPELVDNGRTGLLVRPGDSRDLADRLCELMADPARAARLGEAARSEARSRYSFDRMVAAFEGLYLTRLAAVRKPGGLKRLSAST